MMFRRKSSAALDRVRQSLRLKKSSRKRSSFYNKNDETKNNSKRRRSLGTNTDASLLRSTMKHQRSTSTSTTASANIMGKYEVAKMRVVNQLTNELTRTSLKTALRTWKATNESTESMAKLIVSDIRVPLIWARRDHFKNTGDPRRFCVFAVCYVDDRIGATALVNPITRQHTDVAFDTTIELDPILTNFELHLEIYACRLDQSGSKSSDSNNFMANLRALKGSMSRSLGKKAASEYQNAMMFESNSTFCLVASTKIVFADLIDGKTDFSSHLLTMNEAASQSCPPMDSFVCCRINIQPSSSIVPLFESNMRVMRCGTSEVVFGWTELRAGKLLIRQEQDPAVELLLNKDCVCQLGGQHGLVVLNIPTHFNTQQFVLDVVTHDQAVVLLSALRRQIMDIGRWHKFAYHNKKVPVARKQSFTSTRTRYEDITINGNTLPVTPPESIIGPNHLRAPKLNPATALYGSPLPATPMSTRSTNNRTPMAPRNAATMQNSQDRSPMFHNCSSVSESAMLSPLIPRVRHVSRSARSAVLR